VTPAAQAKVRDWNLAFSIGVPIPETLFDDAFQETQDFILRENPADFQVNGKLPIAPKSYPVLNGLGCTIICNPYEGVSAACVHLGGGAVPGPWGDAATVWGRIENKRQKAAKWTTSPLWLAVDVSLQWKVEDTLAVLRGFIADIDPFERVILFGGRNGLMVSRQTPR